MGTGFCDYQWNYLDYGQLSYYVSVPQVLSTEPQNNQNYKEIRYNVYEFNSIKKSVQHRDQLKILPASVVKIIRQLLIFKRRMGC